MNKELAKTLTTALVQWIDKERPEGTMCCSNTDCENIRAAFEEGEYDVVQEFLNTKLTRLTAFEKTLAEFVNDVLAKEPQNPFIWIKGSGWADKLLAIAKEELARQGEVITLDKLSPYDKGFQDGKAEAMADLDRIMADLDRIRLEAHTKGYNKGYKDAEKQYNESVAYHYPEPVPPGVAYKSPQCYTDVMITPNTNSGTSTLKAEK